MLSAKRLAFAILLLPLAELAAFLAVAWAIGFLAAFGLAILTSVAGFMVLRGVGTGRLAQLRAAVRNGQAAEFQAGGDLVATVLAGLLLAIPGFITDILGGLLLLPPVRAWLQATIRRVARRGSPRTRTDEVIDLDPDDWRHLPDTKLPRPPPAPSER